jgi:hypothetical protein
MMMANPTAASAAATTMTKKTNIWPSRFPEKSRKGHERQVHRIEHQFDAHENGNDITPEDESGGAEDKENHAERQIM